MEKEKGIRLSKEDKEILLLLSQDATASDIIKTINKSKQAVYKHIRRLSKLGLYDANSKHITAMSKHLLTSELPHDRGLLKGDLQTKPEAPKEYRSHKFEVYYHLPEGLTAEAKSKWRQQRGRLLDIRKIKYEARPLGAEGKVRDTGLWFWLDEIQAVAFNNGVYAYFPEITGGSPSESVRMQLQAVAQFGQTLSSRLGINFYKSGGLNIELKRLELAHMGNDIAKELRKQGKKLLIPIDGQRRVVADFSNHINELETLTTLFGIRDMEELSGFQADIERAGGDLKAFEGDLLKSGEESAKEYWKDILVNSSDEKGEREYLLPSEMAKYMAQLLSAITQQSKNLAVQGQHVDKYGEEIAKHLELTSTIIKQNELSMRLMAQMGKAVGMSIKGDKPKPDSPRQIGLNRWIDS